MSDLRLPGYRQPSRSSTFLGGHQRTVVVAVIAVRMMEVAADAVV
jgi:hypothetical protein